MDLPNYIIARFSEMNETQRLLVLVGIVFILLAIGFAVGYSIGWSNYTDECSRIIEERCQIYLAW